MRFGVALFCSCGLVLLSLVQARHPVVLIPGISGSALKATLKEPYQKQHFYCHDVGKEYRIWLNVDILFPGAKNCWLNDFQMTFEDGSYRSTPGVEITPYDFGGVEGINYLDFVEGMQVPQTEYFASLIDALKIEGYSVGKDLFGAPYDWRKPPHALEKEDHWDQLRSLVEKAYELNDNTPVVFVCHSMGNLYFEYFLHHVVDRAWKAQHIAHYIAVAGPFLGAPTALRALLSGLDYFPKLAGHDIVMGPLQQRELFRSLGSFMTLLPQKDLTDAHFNIGDTQYTSDDIATLLDLTKSPTLGPMYSDQLGFLPELHEDPGVPVSCLWGEDTPTDLSLSYPSGDIDVAPNVETTSGDGTVPVASASHCQMWRSVTETAALSQVDHVALVQNATAVNWIVNRIAATSHQRFAFGVSTSGERGESFSPWFMPLFAAAVAAIGFAVTYRRRIGIPVDLSQPLLGRNGEATEEP